MGKVISFFGFVWLLTCIAGGILSGSTVGVSTHLTAALNDTDTVIYVADTNGFSEPGTIIIEGERIYYPFTSATTFYGTAFHPLVRGSSSSTAVDHANGESVRSVENALINNAADYSLAIISDSTGLMAFIQVPTAIFDIIKTFVASPFLFLGTDLAIVTAIWGIAMLGLIVSIGIAVVGGRRV